MNSELELLRDRVAQLESANRAIKLTGAVLILGLVVLFSAGLGGKPQTIEAEKIVILDGHGRARLMIGTPEFTGASVDMKPDSPAIWLSDETGADRTILTSDGLYFANRRGRPLIELSAASNGPALRFHGVDGKVSWAAP